MSNEYKVFDTQTGEDVTGDNRWFISPDGKVWKWLSDRRDMYRCADPDRYQVRRSTGISDKNGRILFDDECFEHGTAVWKVEWIKESSRFGARGVVGGSLFANWYLFPEDIEHIEEGE